MVSEDLDGCGRLLDLMETLDVFVSRCHWRREPGYCSSAVGLAFELSTLSERITPGRPRCEQMPSRIRVRCSPPIAVLDHHCDHLVGCVVDDHQALERAARGDPIEDEVR